MEKLEISADPSLQMAIKWELIPPITLKNLPDLSYHFSTALNNEEILIFGGRSGYSYKKVYIFNTRSEKSTSSAPVAGAFKFNSYTNVGMIAQSGHNKVVALV